MKKRETKRQKNEISKGQLIFQIINTVLVVGILGFYFGRMFYYQKKLAVVYSSTSYAALSSVIVERNDLLKEDRLYENEDGSYYYKGAINNNYINLAGQLFRIISIDADGNMKAIANEAVGQSALIGEKQLDLNPLNSWLNEDVFYKTLDAYAAQIVEGNYNYSVVDDYQNIAKDHVVNSRIGLLSLDEYITAGGSASFLNFGEPYWLANSNSNGKYYFVDENGSIGVSYSESLMQNIRPVVFISYSVKAISGEGTEEDPFILAERNVETIKDVSIGSYIMYKDVLWRVCEPTENGAIKLISASPLEKDGHVITRAFGDNAEFSVTSGIGKYLNSSSLNLIDENYLVLNQWYTGAIDDSFDYRGIFESSCECYVGLPTIADLYLNGDYQFVLATKVNNSNYMNYAINGNILHSSISIDESQLRVMVAVKQDIKLSSGSGSIDDPYIMEVIAHE